VALNITYANIFNGNLLSNPRLVVTQVTLNDHYDYISFGNPVVIAFFIITVLISIGLLVNIVIVIINRDQKDISLRHLFGVSKPRWDYIAQLKLLHDWLPQYDLLLHPDSISIIRL